MQQMRKALLASTYDKSKYFKAADTEKKLKIKNVTEEEIGIEKKEKKLCVWFVNDSRCLVLNITNIRTLSGAFGDDTAGWVGKIIVLFPTMAEFRGTMKPALRVRIPEPKQATAGNGQMDDGIPDNLRRVPSGKASQPKPADIDVDDDLNDEINV